MARLLLFLLLAGMLLGVAAPAATAADSWPDYPDGFHRHGGSYLSYTKIFLCWLLFLLWVRTTDWVSRDCVKLDLNYMLWNSVVLFTFVAAMVLVWLIPWFLLGLPLLLAAYGVPLGLYVRLRNARVEPHEKVLTREHLRHVMAHKAKTIGVKIEEQRRDSRDEGPPVELFAQGGTDRDNSAHLLQSRQSPGFVPTKQLVADTVDKRAQKVMLDYTQQGVGVRYQIDGVWHNAEPLERETGDVMLAVMKTLCALDARQRRARQEGSFAAQWQGAHYQCRLVSQGVKTGERVVVSLGDSSPPPETIEGIGMRAKMFDELKEVMDQPGIVLLAAPPEGGLTTTVDTVLKNIDRYIRSFAAVEEVSQRERDIENIEVTTYDAAAGESPATVLPKLIRTYPDAYVVRDLVNAQSVSLLCGETKDNHLVLSTVRAKEAVEALLRVLLLKVPVDEFAPAVKAVVAQRLVRRLCQSCKEPYAPQPEVLTQMGIPPGRIGQLYRQKQPRPEDEKPEICPECNGLGYRGRTAVFEMLVVNDKIRQALRQGPKLDLLRKLAAQAGMKNFQQEGIVLVAKGVTSLKELLRVLKA